MYKLRYSRLAKKDVEEIIYYITKKLKNTTAAYNLKKEFVKQGDNIITFPYSGIVYNTSNQLDFEYRKVSAKNFYMFYVIDEKNKIITITRVLYNKRDIDNILI